MERPLTDNTCFPHAECAFRWACRLDVTIRKPGNVSLASPGHAMVATQFLASAAAAAGPLFRPGRPVGVRIEASLRATQAAAGCNTNLGILLLCAPLAAAAETAHAADLAALRRSLGRVLDGLDVEDARAAYRAIALAKPGGLGRATSQDVALEPTVDLREAMALAADRDAIARQYAGRFEDVLERGLALFAGQGGQSARSLPRRVQRLFVGLLAALPDSHIARKFGDDAAREVSAEAALWTGRLQAASWADVLPAFAAWDESLKSRGFNPGTTADLTVATLFVAALLDPRLLVQRVDAGA